MSLLCLLEVLAKSALPLPFLLPAASVHRRGCLHLQGVRVGVSLQRFADQASFPQALLIMQVKYAFRELPGLTTACIGARSLYTQAVIMSGNIVSLTLFAS